MGGYSRRNEVRISVFHSCTVEVSLLAQSPYLAFLEVCVVESDSCRAAVLVTDRSTDPVEFRCTSIIKPNPLQKVLWGGRLSSHLATHILGKPLIDSLTQTISLVVVRHPSLLELRPLIPYPMVRILSRAEDGQCHLLDENVSAPNVPTYLRVWNNDQSDIRQAREILAPTIGRVDLTEPFSRLLKALAALHRQENNEGI